MNIIEFIESQCQEFQHLKDKSKALALLEATKQRMLINSRHLSDRKTDVTTMFVPLNIPENFLIELLKSYLNAGSFEAIPIIENKRDNQTFEEIKQKLQSIFN